MEESMVKKTKNIKNFTEDIRDYRFIVSATIIEQKIRESNIKVKRPVVELMNIKSKLVIVHCFTEFVFLWKQDSYNTMKSKANTLSRFLNFIIQNNSRYNLSNFSQLEVLHGEDYLNHLAVGGKHIDYVNSEKNTLDKFYRFLYKKELFKNCSQQCEEIFQRDFLYIRKDKRRRNKIYPVSESIFNEYTKPSNVANQNKLHILKEEFVIPFLETAIEIEPRIALGIFFQMFGALRVSEVINLRKSQISFMEWGIRNVYVIIGDEIISDKIKDITQGCNKKKRKQKIYNIGNYLPELLQKHLVTEKYFSSDGTDALFSNKKGRIMTSNRYYRYFTNVKNEFIKKLIQSSDMEIKHYGVFLKMSNWSTHIGRGIGSNFIADATENEYLVAKFRGDSCLDSSLTYTEDTQKHQDMIYKSGSKMYEIGIKMKERMEENSRR